MKRGILPCLGVFSSSILTRPTRRQYATTTTLLRGSILGWCRPSPFPCPYSATPRHAFTTSSSPTSSSTISPPAPCSSTTSNETTTPNTTTSHPHRPKPLLVLSIETSCDDTCVSLLSLPTPTTAILLHNARLTTDNTQTRGVEPAVTVLAHTSRLAVLVEETLGALPHAKDSNIDPIRIKNIPRMKPDIIAVTRGPGMMSNLAVGLNTAKGLALAMQRPIVGVHHMQAHALTPGLVAAMERFKEGSSKSESAALEAGMEVEGNNVGGFGSEVGHGARERVVQGGVREGDKSPESGKALMGGEDKTKDGPGNGDITKSPPPSTETVEEPQYPYLTLLVSGGHTQLSLSLSPTSHPVLCAVSSLALGRMLDQSARLILPPELLAQHDDVMYARLMEKFAFPNETEQDITNPTTDTNTNSTYPFYKPPTTRAQSLVPSQETMDAYNWALPIPLSKTRALEYDFTGLRGAITKLFYPDIPNSNPSNTNETSNRTDPHPTRTPRSIRIAERRIMAREVQRIAFEHLVSRIIFILSGSVDSVIRRASATPEARPPSASPQPQQQSSPEPQLSQSTPQPQAQQSNPQPQPTVKPAQSTPQPQAPTPLPSGPQIKTLLLSGGVASNKFLLHILKTNLAARGLSDVKVVAPPGWLCTDNAAMIAWTGAQIWKDGWSSTISVTPLKKWSVDPRAEDGGVMGVGGWVRRVDREAVEEG